MTVEELIEALKRFNPKDRVKIETADGTYIPDSAETDNGAYRRVTIKAVEV